MRLSRLYHWLGRSVALSSLLAAPGCTSHGVMLVQPQSGDTMECSGSGYGLGAAIVQSNIEDCIRRGQNRGFVPVDKLSPAQRLDLEKRGRMPKNAPG